jgi:hypothetical protein
MILSLGLTECGCTGDNTLNDAMVDFVASLIGVGPEGGGIRSPLNSELGGNHRKHSRSRQEPAAASKNIATASGMHPDLWDLDKSNRLYLFNQSLSFTIRCVSRGPYSHFFICSFSNDAHWTLALTSPTDVLQAWRVCPLSARELAKTFLAIGIPFCTFRSLPSDWRPREQRSRWDCQHIPFTMEIPYRTKNYEFTHADYIAYERQRTRLLSQPHALAAAKLGGIIWRLSRGHLSEEDVLEGPSRTSRSYGFGIFIDDSHHPGHKLCDDSLTPDELDAICGLHTTTTGIFFKFIFFLHHLITPFHSHRRTNREEVMVATS